ncbi:hypothetical protein Aph01nite_01700 [Acrocarpospora phusangensis]|uniref:Uncharacterized protein n=1 Tax=Acrocarpospora phusangensis TaxID=1070424 RepID=A0A919UML1_9ACTN|nr:DUF6343 family protein [Acrocarpospora phusangensis]GIH21860.1 hypothetical protein Aph01nite_01700 [Acrocarpospora phusangensis]
MNKTHRIRDRFWSEVSPTMERPESALNLRIALATFGLVVCIALGALSWLAGWWVAAVALGVVALISIVNLVVVERKRRERGDGHSLFE